MKHKPGQNQDIKKEKGHLNKTKVSSHSHIRSIYVVHFHFTFSLENSPSSLLHGVYVAHTNRATILD